MKKRIQFVRGWVIIVFVFFLTLPFRWTYDSFVECGDLCSYRSTSSCDQTNFNFQKKWSGISGNQEQVYLSSKKMLDFNHNTCMHSCIYIYVGLCLHPCELLKCTYNAANGRSYLMNTLTYYKHQIVRSTCRISWVCVCFLLRLHFHRCIALHCIFRSYFSPYITEIKIKPFHICSRNHARIDQRKE